MKIPFVSYLYIIFYYIFILYIILIDKQIIKIQQLRIIVINKLYLTNCRRILLTTSKYIKLKIKFYKPF